MAELTNEMAWWQPRLGKKLKDLSTSDLKALAAGMRRCLDEPSEGERLLEKIEAELAARDNPPLVA